MTGARKTEPPEPAELREIAATLAALHSDPKALTYGNEAIWSATLALLAVAGRSADDKLRRLRDRCRCGVHITINSHRDIHETAAQAIEKAIENGDDLLAGSDAALLDRMRATDSIVEIQFYPETPAAFWRVLHWDLDEALDEALACFGSEPC